MKIRNLLISAILAVAPAIASAQSMKTNYDEKEIYTDSLNLPANTSILTVISLLPEIMQRPGEFIISNYDIQIEDMSVGDCADVALAQLRIHDVEKIVISESAVSSYQNNGEGGSVNIILRASGKDGSNTWGSAGAHLAHPVDIIPQFNVGYKKEDFMVRALILGEVYNRTLERESTTYIQGMDPTYSLETSDSKFRTQLARVYLQVNPSPKDMLKINLSQSYTYDKKLTTPNRNENLMMTNETKSTRLQAFMKYEHNFGRSLLTTEAQYAYNPGSLNNNTPNVNRLDKDYHTHNMSGKVELKSLFNFNKAKDYKGYLYLGTSLNNNYSDENISRQVLFANESGNTEYKPKNNSYYVMPYINMEGVFGKFRVKLACEYQHYRYYLSRSSETFSKSMNDFTGKLMAEWHFTPHKNLRLIVDRKLDRPSNYEIFPYTVYDPEFGSYILGNSDLVPAMSHEVKLEYIADYRWDAHSLMFNVGVSYNNVQDIIDVQNDNSSNTQTVKPTTFINSGKNNIINTNLMALYSYKSFCLSLTGNIYHNAKNNLGSKNHYTYYNIAFYPYFNLPAGWNGGVKLSYYSNVDEESSSLGRYGAAAVTVGKAWNKFYIYVSENLPLQIRSHDTYYLSSTKHIVEHHELENRYFGVGFRYSF